MEQNQENPFLNKEAAYLKSYDEAADNFDMEKVVEQAQADDQKVYEQQVFDTFVKEKGTILSTVFDLLVFAAKIHEIDHALLFKTESQIHRNQNLKTKIHSERDALNIKNRLTLIFLKYQEQSSILDSILAEVIEPIMRFV